MSPPENPTAKLCTVVQGVQFNLWVEPVGFLRAIILRDALVELFGASEDSSNWVETYQQYREFIDAVAIRLHEQSPQVKLAILSVPVLQAHYAECASAQN